VVGVILSDTPAKKRQVNALGRARAWRGSKTAIRRAIEEAANAYPLSEIQWFNLMAVHGPDFVSELRKHIELRKRVEAVRA
jgi:hypothetical protein